MRPTSRPVESSPRSLAHRRKQLREAVALMRSDPDLVPPGAWAFWSGEAVRLGVSLPGSC